MKKQSYIKFIVTSIIMLIAFGLFLINSNKTKVEAAGSQNISFLSASGVESSKYSVSGGKLTSFTANSPEDLVALSQLNPSLYDTATILINNSSGTDFLMNQSYELKEGESFAYIPLGSSSNPFKGAFQATGTSIIVIMMDNSLFDYLDTRAVLAEDLRIYRTAGSGTAQTAPLIANYLVGATTTKTYKANIYSYQNASVSFGGVFGTIDSDLNVTINVNNQVGDSLSVSSNDNAGYLCGTLKSGATLKVGTLNTSIPNITANNGAAGSIVGLAEAGATIDISSYQTGYNKVVNGKYAGGLVGKATDLIVKMGSYNFTNNNATITGSEAAGSFIGSYTYTGEVDGAISSFNTDKYGMTGSFTKEGTSGNLVCKTAVNSANHTGGLVGELFNNKDGYSFEISGSNIVYAKTTTGNYQGGIGGLIGYYDSTSLSSSLVVSNMTIIYDISAWFGGAFGGVVGLTGTSSSYIKFNNLNITTHQANGSGYYGGLVGYSYGGDFIDIKDVTISAYNGNGNSSVYADGFSASNSGGGLVGSIEKGAIRLSGLTDLTDAAPATNATNAGQLVGKTGDDNGYNTVIFSNGSGSNSAWTFNRTNLAVKNSDVALHNTVLRNVTSDIISVSETNHTVTVGAFSNTLSSKKAAILYYIYYTTHTTSSDNGSLKYTSSDNAIWNNGTINITSDIDLSGTGLNGLTFEDKVKQNALTINGGNHTITLAIGEPYGLIEGSAISYTTETIDGSSIKIYRDGVGQVYDHAYTGFIGCLYGTSKVENLTFNGNVYYGANRSNNNEFIGVFATTASSTLTIKNVDISTNFIGYVNNSFDKFLFASSYIGATINEYSPYDISGSTSNITITDSEWTGIMYTTSTLSKYIIAGVVTYIGASSRLSISSSTLGGKIVKTNEVSSNLVGGLVAATDVTTNRKYITIKNVTVSEYISYEGEAGVFNGGLLGTYWISTDVEVSGLLITGSTLETSNATFGGLVYQTSGIFTIKKDTYDFGVKFDGNNSFSSNTADQDNPSALLIECVYNTSRTSCINSSEFTTGSGYVEIEENSYVITGTVVLGGSIIYFDEIVGRSIAGDYYYDTFNNGIVSIGSSTSPLTLYQKQLLSYYTNTKVMYYYNLDTIRATYASTFNFKAITRAEHFELLSAATICKSDSYIAGLFGNSTKDITAEKTVKQTINFTGVSYYPINDSFKITITATSIVFDSYDYSTLKKDSNIKKGRHYMMNSGLFLNMTSGIFSISGTKLSGSVSNINSNYCGALIMKIAKGAGQTSMITINITNVTLDGLYIVNASGGYAPLLINTILNYSTLSINGIHTTSAYTKDGSTKQVASSLIGNVGSDENGAYINLSFANIGLDGRTEASDLSTAYYNYGTYNTIFTSAILLESFKYTETLTCSGVYTFNSTDTYITYGQELSNTNSTGGRNPESQNTYYDNDSYVTDGYTISYPADGFATYLYLRYIATQENAELFCFELDINQKSYNLIVGCGTYSDPYLIDKGMMIDNLANYLNGGSPANWAICVNSSVFKNQANTSNEKGKNYAYYILVGGQWFVGSYDSSTGKVTETTTSANNSKLNINRYLRNAYYMIVDNITVGGSGNYIGLGTQNYKNNLQSTAFSGVIVGKQLSNGYPTITVIAPNVNVTGYSGLIRYGNGAVVKNINISYPNTYMVGGNEVANQVVFNSSEVLTKTRANVSTSTIYSKENQLFFGGVIGWSIGGDNIIDNVSVNIGSSYISIIGSKSKYVSVGGYVGIVGGCYLSGDNDNTTGGGGVLFRNDANVNDFYVNNSAKTSYYHKNYIGVVYDGYAFSEGVTINNNGPQYAVVNLENYTDSGISVSGTDVSISSTFGLYLLSQIVNSGAASMDGSNIYKNDAYRYGKMRYSDYDNIGVASVAIPTEEQWWGGINNDVDSKISYLLYKYDLSDSVQFFTASSTRWNISITSNIDFTKFDGLYKGIGTNYSPRNKNCEKALMNLYTFDGKNKTIKLNTSIKEYGGEAYDLKGLGLFSSISMEAGLINFNDVIITGKFEISYDTEYYIPDSSLGGLVGTCGGTDKSNNGIVFRNVKSQKLTLSGAKNVGGFLGANYQYVTMYTDGNWQTGFKKSASLSLFKCSSVDSTVLGAYTAGGFVGLSKNDGIKVFDVTTITNATVKQTYNTTLYDHLVYPSYKASDNFVGAGGVAGFSEYIRTLKYDNNSQKTTYINIKGCIFSNVQQSYNSDCGVGGVVGVAFGQTSSIYNVTIEDTKIYCDIKVDFQTVFTGIFTEIQRKIYFGGALGSVVGYSKGELVVDVVVAKKIIIRHGSFNGGIVGIQGGKKSTISNVSFNELSMYSEETSGYYGTSSVGGIYGTTNFEPFVSDILIYNSTITNHGPVGGIVGHLYNNDNNASFAIKIINVSIVETIIASSGIQSNKFLSSGNVHSNAATAHSSLTKADLKNNDKDMYDGASGFIIGSGNFKKEVLGTNVLIKDSLVGTILRKNSSSYDVITLGVDETSKMTLSAANIGVKNSSGWKAYDAIDNFTSLTSYINGYVGYVVGCGSDSNATYSIYGLKLDCDYLPTLHNGSVSKGINNIVFADYYGASEEHRTSNEGNPYVTSYPSVDLGGLTLVGDGVGIDSEGNPVVLGIINDTKSYTNYNLIYNKIISNAASYDTSVISKYWTIEDGTEYNYGYSTKFNDFTCLLIKDATVATDIIKGYIPLITNSTITTYTISVKTYKCINGVFVETTSSLIYDGNSFAGVNGAYDNGRGQITVIYVSYGSGDYEYTLTIPVIVQKILYFDFYASTALGTSYYDAAYTNNKSATLAESGSAITVRFTYVYERTTAEWLSAINLGENLNFSTNRKGLNIASTYDIPANTYFVFVDKYQKGNKAYYYQTETSIDATARFMLSDYFNDWESIYLCDLLNPTAQTADDGLFIVCEEEYATIRIYDSSSKSYIYYRLVTDEDIANAEENGEELTRYNITIDPTSTVKIGTNTYVEEAYYLTMYIPTSSGELLNNFISFAGSANVKKIDSGHIETQINNTVYSYYKDVKKITSANENVYLFGEFLTQEAEVTSLEDEKLIFTSGTNKSVTINVSDEITIVNDNFNGYTTSNSTLYQQFSISTKDYNSSGVSSAGFIPAGTTITYKFRVKDSSGNVLRAYQTLNYTVSAKSSVVNLVNDVNLISYFKTYGNTTVIIEGDVTFTYSQAQFMEQFMAKPEGTVSDAFGTSYVVKSNFSMSKSGLSVSTATDEDQTDNHYYRDEMNLVTLNYFAIDSEFTDNASGDVSTLGKNGLPENDEIVGDVSTINTIASYDATSISTSGAKYLCVSLTLSVKNNDGVYVPVDEMVSGTTIASYLTNVKIYGNSVSKSDLDKSTESVFKGYYAITNDDLGLLSSNILIVNISYDVYIGEALKAIGGYFSNYKVTLSISLCDKDKNVLEGSTASDYIIYSNIMFNSDIMKKKETE